MLNILRLVILFSILLGLPFAQYSISQTKSTTIEAIINNPTAFEASEVEFSGLVTQYVIDKGSTNYYLIRGDYGGIIRVNTAEPPPETNVKYLVKGIVYIDGNTKRPFVSEKVKSPIEFPDPVLTGPNSVEKNENFTINWNAENATKVTLNGNPVEIKGTRTLALNESTTFTVQAQYPNGKFKEKSLTITILPQQNWLLYILIAALVILVIVFIYFQVRKRNIDSEVIPASAYQEPLQPQQQSFNATEFKEAKPEFTDDTQFKTIKMVKTQPKTLKFIPGKFVITEGLDKGKEFRVAGFPTSEGFVVTVGRKELSGDSAYAHIHLNEKTVSREQAELHYIDHKLYLKNLSETNPTQLNGVEIRPGKTIEVTPGSVIKTGEVEFKYVV